MAGESDLEQAVGASFGIQDTQTPSDSGDSGADTSQDTSGGDVGGQTGDQSAVVGNQAAIGGDQQQGQQRERSPDDQQYADRAQLFDKKPQKGPKGELLGKDGQVVATTRREKQLAYNLNRAQYAANIANRENRRLVGALQQYSALHGMIRDSRLNPEHVREALALRARAERDPINTVRDIIAKVLASGVTMDQIFGSDAVPAINAQIITNELDRRLGPLERREQQAARQTRVNQQAREQLEDFLFNHEHAAVHGVEIAQMVEQQQIPPERAYFELRSWAERRGLDFSQPLKPQVLRAIQQQQQRGGKQAGAGTNANRSTPGSVRTGNGAATQERGNNRGDFKATEPWGNIARAVMHELNNR